MRTEALQETGQPLLPADDAMTARREAVHNDRQGRLDDFFPVSGEEIVAEKNDVEAPRGWHFCDQVVDLPADAFPEFLDGQTMGSGLVFQHCSFVVLNVRTILKCKA